MITDHVERSTDIINRIEGLELVPHAMRLLADGEPVSLERLAAAAGRPLEEVQAALGEQTAAEFNPIGQLDDVRSAVRQHGQFFASPQAAAQWAAEHPEGEIRPVEEAFAVDRQVVTQVGWAAR